MQEFVETGNWSLQINMNNVMTVIRSITMDAQVHVKLRLGLTARLKQTYVDPYVGMDSEKGLSNVTMEMLRALMDVLHHVFWKKTEFVTSQSQTNVISAEMVNVNFLRFCDDSIRGDGEGCSLDCLSSL